MRNILIAIMIISWVIFVTSMLLMSPKWWLWAGIAWSGWWDNYWSKKSVEWTLKKSAIISAIIFMSTAIILPYL